MTFDNAVVPDTFLRPVARPKGRFQELTPAVSLSKEPVSFISSCTFLSLSIVSLSMFSGIFPSRFRQALRPSVFVRRKNFAKVRRKFVTSKFFFSFFAVCFRRPQSLRRSSTRPPRLRRPQAGSSLASRKRVQRYVLFIYPPNIFTTFFGKISPKPPQKPSKSTPTDYNTPGYTTSKKVHPTTRFSHRQCATIT